MSRFPGTMMSLALVILTAMASGGCGDPRVNEALRRHPVDTSLRQDWVRKDVEAILGFRDALPVKGDAEGFFKSLDPQTPVEWGELGFGLKQATAWRVGGHLTCGASVLALDNELADVSLFCRGNERSWPKIRPLVEGLLGPGFEAGKNSLEKRTRFDGVLARAKAKAAAALGPQAAVDVPPELAEAYERLLAVDTSLTFGSYCGAAGSPPNGRREIETLVKASRYDLVRNVLRGYNRVGRIYAAAALLSRPPLEPADAATIRTLRAMPLKISTCNGCIPGTKTAAEILGDPDSTPAPTAQDASPVSDGSPASDAEPSTSN